MHYSQDKTSQLIEVYSYLVAPKDTRWSFGELAGPSDETVICYFSPYSHRKGGCEIVNSAQRHQRRRELPRCLRVKTSLIGIQCISMGPGPVMLHIFMNSSSPEVWRGKQGIGENRVQFTVWVRCPLSWTVLMLPGSTQCQAPLHSCCNANNQDCSLLCRANSSDSPLIAHENKHSCL